MKYTSTFYHPHLLHLDKGVAGEAEGGVNHGVGVWRVRAVRTEENAYCILKIKIKIRSRKRVKPGTWNLKHTQTKVKNNILKVPSHQI
jgi:hypothetical protein